MRRWHQGGKTRARIEIIPMIDVMMFLLVFFVLISIDVIPAIGIKTRLPMSTSAEPGAARYNVIVSLGPDGKLQLNGADLNLEALEPRLAGLRKIHPQALVIVNGDQAAALQRVVDVMDRIKAAGFQAMSIAVQKRTAP